MQCFFFISSGKIRLRKKKPRSVKFGLKIVSVRVYRQFISIKCHLQSLHLKYRSSLSCYEFVFREIENFMERLSQILQNQGDSDDCYDCCARGGGNLLESHRKPERYF